MQDPTGQQSMVNFSQLSSNFPNMNPALNDQMAAPENVQVINVLNQTQDGGATLEQQAMADVGFLEGIPGTMFDWGASFPPRVCVRACVAC